MLYEQLQIPEILATPTEEIARWISKINLVNYALDQNHSIYHWGGHASGSQIEYEFAARAEEGIDWKTDEDWNKVVLYEMKRGIDYTALAYASEASSTAEKKANIGKTALREGLARISFLPELNDISLPVKVPKGIVAAFSFLRADIEEDLDRKLFDRKQEIRTMVSVVESNVQPRKLSYFEKIVGSKEKVRVVRSVYNFASYPLSDDYLEKLDLDAGNVLEPWWQELVHDLDRINAVHITF